MRIKITKAQYSFSNVICDHLLGTKEYVVGKLASRRMARGADSNGEIEGRTIMAVRYENPLEGRQHISYDEFYRLGKPSKIEFRVSRRLISTSFPSV